MVIDAPILALAAHIVRLSGKPPSSLVRFCSYAVPVFEICGRAQVTWEQNGFVERPGWTAWSIICSLFYASAVFVSLWRCAKVAERWPNNLEIELRATRLSIAMLSLWMVMIIRDSWLSTILMDASWLAYLAGVYFASVPPQPPKRVNAPADGAWETP